MLKIAEYKCPHCQEEITLDIIVTPPKWDELYGTLTCSACGEEFEGKAAKLMTKSVPEIKFVGGKQKGKQNSQARW
jgi:transcription elongation factor Elf1